MHWPPLPPRKYSWYSFLLEVGSTSGQQCGRKDYVNEKFHWNHRESKPRPSGSWRSASTNCATTCPPELQNITILFNKIFCLHSSLSSYILSNKALPEIEAVFHITITYPNIRCPPFQKLLFSGKYTCGVRFNLCAIRRLQWWIRKYF